MRRPPINWRRRSAIATSSCRIASSAPVVKDDTLLSVVRFSSKAPSWLIDQLERIERVDSVDDGFKSDADEWITPDAYHRERRGGRSMFVEPSRYRFGAAGKTQRLEAIQKVAAVAGSPGRHLTLAISKLATEVSALRVRIAGVDAVKELRRARPNSRKPRAPSSRSRPSAWKWARAWASCRC
jgi:hypothetical protein